MTAFSRPESACAGYSVRRSSRARCLQLRVSPLGRVEVVVPVGVSLSAVPAFVETHRAWIERTLARFRLQGAQRPEFGEALPQHIRLTAIGEHWRVEQADALVRPLLSRRTADGPLLLLAPAAQYEQREHLRRWLTVRAKQTLVPWLHRVSEEVGLPFAKATVRAQKSRWGSCSARKNISINRGLLFLPAPVVRYLFVHELCHTVHLNHSARYWKLVERLEPDYRSLDAVLRQATYAVPYWAQTE